MNIMPTNFTYTKLRKLRQTLYEELLTQFPTLTLEHYRLLEMRIQTAIMAGLLEMDTDEAAKEWKGKKP